jgi:arsenate reductase (thioredoxin)
MSHTKSVDLYPAISSYLELRRSEFDQIPDFRQLELQQLAAYVRQHLPASVKLTFICTHNSRRSHLSQIWAKVAADVVGLSEVETFSGGTEATAMNPRVVDSLRRTGFVIDSSDASVDNPIYEVQYTDDAAPLRCFSKVYDESPNPTAGYCAIMTCASADEACPLVSGCDLRLPIRYDDPKVSDGTPQEAVVYDERSAQISREMLFAMSQV